MNKVYLLDTNIVSEFSKECPDQNVISLYEQRKDLCAISAVTWQELQYGLSKMPDGKRKNSIENFISLLKQRTRPFRRGNSQRLCGFFRRKA